MSSSRAMRSLAAAVLLAPQPVAPQAADAPYVATPDAVVEAMLEIAGVGPADYLVDLGSGDGRIVITAARKYGARGLGVELDGALVNDARREARRQGVGDRTEFLAQNLFITDVRPATVVTMYLLQGVNLQLRPRLLAELRPGARVVSHEFDMGSWQPDSSVRLPVPDKPYGAPVSEVFLWVVPARAAGVWRWSATVAGAPIEYELALQQTFQMLEGRVIVAGREGAFSGGRMRGERIRFTLTADVSGRSVRHEYSGRVSGDTVSGTVRLAGSGELEWNATRVKREKIEER